MQNIPAHLLVDEPQPPDAPSLGCAGGGRGCPGMCCDPVWLPIPPDHLRAIVQEHPGNLDGEWFLAHFTHRPDAVPIPGTGGWAYDCDAFVDGICTAHEARPPMCRTYPHNTGAVIDPRRTFLHSRCSYWHDVDPTMRAGAQRPFIPIEDVTKR